MKEPNKYAESLRYISAYWKKITYYHPIDARIHLGLPNKYIAPNNDIFKNDQFYWDTYFVILGLVKDKQIKLAKGMVDNFVYLFDRFNIIPMRNRYYNLGTSQIPFLTSMAFEIFENDPDKQWLRKVLDVAELELNHYWMNPRLTEKHIIYKKLSRYCDHYITHLGAEHESGWDMTSRFNDHCLDYLPVDLNACLYKYEMDLAKGFTLVRNHKKAKKMADQAARRKTQMNELMWDEKKNYFFDYDMSTEKRSDFLSVAGFYPLWAGLATPEQADLIHKKVLSKFEFDGGIVNSQSKKISTVVKQHDYPNGWPNQQWIVIDGLLKYGYKASAERIARKWVDMNLKLFTETGKFWEKYDVLRCQPGVYNAARYPTQSGFAWTNAIYLRLIERFSMK